MPNRSLEIILPSWVIMVAGFLMIGVIALMLALVAQARLIDALDLKTSILQAETTRVLAENAIVRRDIKEKNAQLSELQQWRIIITVATRLGWDAANRYILSTKLEMSSASEHAGGEEF